MQRRAASGQPRSSIDVYQGPGLGAVRWNQDGTGRHVFYVKVGPRLGQALGELVVGIVNLKVGPLSKPLRKNCDTYPIRRIFAGIIAYRIEPSAYIADTPERLSWCLQAFSLDGPPIPGEFLPCRSEYGLDISICQIQRRKEHGVHGGVNEWGCTDGERRCVRVLQNQPDLREGCNWIFCKVDSLKTSLGRETPTRVAASHAPQWLRPPRGKCAWKARN